MGFDMRQDTEGEVVKVKAELYGMEEGDKCPNNDDQDGMEKLDFNDKLGFEFEKNPNGGKK